MAFAFSRSQVRSRSDQYQQHWMILALQWGYSLGATVIHPSVEDSPSSASPCIIINYRTRQHRLNIRTSSTMRGTSANFSMAKEILFVHMASRTTPHRMKIKPTYCPPGPLSLGHLPTGDNSPPDENKAQLLPTRTIIPRTTPHWGQSPPDENKAYLLPTRTTIPRTTPHWGQFPTGWK